MDLQYENDIQSRAKSLVLPRVWELRTRTQGTAIPERIRTKVLDISAVSHAFRDELWINKLGVEFLSERFPPDSMRIQDRVE